MEYGILVAVDEDTSQMGFQIIGSVNSREEAIELRDQYIAVGPENGYVPPWEFQIHKRGRNGAYTVIDHLSFAEAE